MPSQGFVAAEIDLLFQRAIAAAVQNGSRDTVSQMPHVLHHAFCMSLGTERDLNIDLPGAEQQGLRQDLVAASCILAEACNSIR